MSMANLACIGLTVSAAQGFQMAYSQNARQQQSWNHQRKEKDNRWELKAVVSWKNNQNQSNQQTKKPQDCCMLAYPCVIPKASQEHGKNCILRGSTLSFLFNEQHFTARIRQAQDLCLGMEKLPSQQLCPGTPPSFSCNLLWSRLLTYLEGTWCCWPCSARLVKVSHVFSCLQHICRSFSHLTGSLHRPLDNVLMLILKAVLLVRTQNRTRTGLNSAATGTESWNCTTSLVICIWNEATTPLKKAQTCITFKLYTIPRQIKQY